MPSQLEPDNIDNPMHVAPIDPNLQATDVPMPESPPLNKDEEFMSKYALRSNLFYTIFTSYYSTIR